MSRKPKQTKQQCRQALLSLLVQRVRRMERERIENDRRLSRRYWLETVQPYIEERKLWGVELHIAQHAYGLLRRAIEAADDWNRTVEGQLSPIILQDTLTDHMYLQSAPNHTDPRFAEPEPLYADDLKSETLVSLAGLFLPRLKATASPVEAIRRAQNLLFAAERYVSSMPKRPAPGHYTEEAARTIFSQVTFGEIIASNQKDSGCLPLLPKLVKRQDKESGELLPLSQDGLEKAVKKFKGRRVLHATEADYNRNLQQDNARRAKRGLPPEQTTFQRWQIEQQAEIGDCLENGRILFHELAAMRWERFKDFALKQHRPASSRPKRRK